ncbi:MAG: helix-turn-helix domain-containing protein [Candidatus Woesearchaeota archaeon]
MDSFEDKILSRIKALRKERGYSQEYMANRLEITRPSYGRIEQGKTSLTIDNLEEILNIFDLTVSELMTTGKIAEMKQQLKSENFNQHSFDKDTIFLYDQLLKDSKSQIDRIHKEFRLIFLDIIEFVTGYPPHVPQILFGELYNVYYYEEKLREGQLYKELYFAFKEIIENSDFQYERDKYISNQKLKEFDYQVTNDLSGDVCNQSVIENKSKFESVFWNLYHKCFFDIEQVRMVFFKIENSLFNTNSWIFNYWKEYKDKYLT